MRTIRIYQPGHFQVGDVVELNSGASHHAAIVLRMRPGDKLRLFSNDNYEYHCFVLSVQKNRVSVQVEAVVFESRESPKKIHLAQGVSKGDKMELVVQKAVELGVHSIYPLITQHCALKWDQAKREKKQAQWQAIAIGACEQSGRNQVPEVHPICSLNEYLSLKTSGLQFVLSPEAQKSWRDYSFAADEIGLLVGPEGGLSGEEMARLKSQGFSPLSLGPRVLRTETAALVGLALLQAVCGDL